MPNLLNGQYKDIIIIFGFAFLSFIIFIILLQIHII